jgi:superfamily II DNA or RNA helicase
MTGLLHQTLTYTHRKMNYDMFTNFRGGAKDVTYVPVSLYREREGKLYTTQGMLRRIQDRLAAAGIPVVYEDLRPKLTLEPDYEHLRRCMPNLEFRLKQDEILARIIALDSGVFKAPTAYGKTFIMLAVAALFPAANVIITSPSTALLRSIYRRLLQITPDVCRIGGGHCDKPGRVTLCTYNSLLKAPVHSCDILLVDECHKAAAPNISDSLAKINNPVKIFGMTATPTGRSDSAELAIEALIGPIIYRIEYDEAAASGLISQLYVWMINMPAALAPCHSIRYSSKVAKKRWCYWRNTTRNKALATAVTDCVQRFNINADPQVLVLAETVEHAFRLQANMPEFEIVYAGMPLDQQLTLKDLGLIDPDFKPMTSAQREDILRRFEQGTAKRVIATGCWGEGVDFTHLDVLVNASGASSPISTVQWAGRASRKYAGKQYGLLIDSMDQWDPWALSRAKTRLSHYKTQGWHVCDEDTDMKGRDDDTETGEETGQDGAVAGSESDGAASA